MRRALIAALAVLAAPVLFASGARAQASTDPENLGVSITIEEACEISNVQDLAFGEAGILSAAVTTTGSVDVTCTDGTDYEIALDEGSGDEATVAARKMTGPGSATITYSLYSEATYTTVWGDTLETNTVTGTGNGSAQTATIYGRVGPQAQPAPGEYSDTVSIIVHY